MKLLTCMLMLLIAQFAASQNSVEKELKTSIKEVTVFLQGAQITRQGSVTLKAGTTILLVKSQSPFVDEKSILVKAEGDFTLLSVNHKYDFLNELTRDKKVDSLYALIESYGLEQSTAKSRLEVLKEKESLLNENKSLGGADEGASLVELKQALDFYDKELTLIKQEAIRIGLQVKELAEKKLRIEKQIADVTSQFDLPSGQIAIKVEAKNDVSADFTISYLVANAGWYPNYDIRVQSIDQPIELKYKADVYQNTGEDWENVKLRFSNANPNQSGVAPNLYAWHLNYARNTIYTKPNTAIIDRSVRSVSGKIMDEQGEPLPGANVIVKGSTIGTVCDINGNYQLTLPSNAEYLIFSFVGYNTVEMPINNSRVDLAMELDESALEEVVVTGYGTTGSSSWNWNESSSVVESKVASSIKTTLIENQTTVEFEVEVPYTIKSNGEKLTLDLNKFAIETIYEYYAVPKLEKDAFLIARIINWDQYNLLEGEANLFFEDAYVGRSVLDAKSLTDTLDISLGRDKNIVIGRTKVDEYSERKSVGSNTIDRRGFDLVIRNKKPQSVKLTLFDQIPIASISEITVNPLELSNGVLTSETGEITWQLTVEPQQQIELRLGYEVKYPKKEKVVLE